MKVLQVFYGINRGGIETIFLNYYKYMNRKDLCCDVICEEDFDQVQLKEYLDLGCHVYSVKQFKKRIVSNFLYIKKLCKENEYDIIHCRLNYRSVLPLLAAKIAGVPVRIAHSHTSEEPSNWKRNIERIICTIFLRMVATDYMGCSDSAAQWMIGKNTRYTILNNSIESEKFEYNEKIRKYLRTQYGIKDDEFVVGNIGRMVEQKNQKYLIEVFDMFQKKYDKTKLVLVGDGPLRKLLYTEVEQRGILEKVIFTGFTDKAYEYYSIFDVFVLPSIYEGWGNVLIEAQCNGLTCLASKCVIPENVNITGLVNFIPLDEKEEWSNMLINALNNHRLNVVDKIIEEGFDVKRNANFLQEYYNNCIVREKKNEKNCINN